MAGERTNVVGVVGGSSRCSRLVKKSSSGNDYVTQITIVSDIQLTVIIVNQQ